MKRNKAEEVTRPDRVMSYFKHEIPVLAVITVSGLLYNIGMAAGPYYEGQMAQRLYDIMKGLKEPQSMLHLAGIYVLVILFVQLARALKRYYVRIFANDISKSMRHILYRSLVHMDAEKLQHEKMGALMTKAIADVDACAEGMRKFTTEVFDTGVVMVVYLVMLLSLDWRLTLLSVLFTPLAYALSNRLKRKISSVSAAYKESASKLNEETMDRVGNALTYRLFGREENRNLSYEARLTDYEKKSARANIFESSLTPVYDAIAMLGTVMILFFGAKNVLGNGWTTWNIASFTTFLACFVKLATKTSHAAKLFNAVQKAAVSWKRIKPFMKTVPEDAEAKEQVLPVSLSFQDVSLGYSEDRKLSDINFHAEPGEIIGITGVVASGKSMLGKVLLDLVPWEGKIFLGSKDFRALTSREKHDFITYMGHEPELLSVSVSENITLGEDISPKPWLKAVCLDREVSELPRGIETPVGEGGTQLSGGQQARLALARTLAHAGSILVLDDPLAAVDKETETRILENIRALCKDKVVLLISHRLTHFPELSKVLFLHDGTATPGSHAELMACSEAYRTLYEKQMKGGDQDEA